MKVLLVTTIFRNGIVGPATFSKYMFDNKKFKCDILTENIEPTESIHNVKIELSPIKEKLSVYSRIKLYQKEVIALAQDYDIILFTSSLLAYKLPSLKTPVVVMVNDDNLVKQGFPKSKLTLAYYFYRRLEKRVLKKSKSIIAPSVYVKQLLADGYNVSPSKIKCIYQATKFKPQARAQSRFVDTLVKVLFVKNDYIRGGLLDLIKALSLLKSYSFELFIAGCQPDKNQLLAGDNTLVTLLGNVPHEEMEELLGTKDILCIPARKEALGVANMEAMAVGLPVVTTNVGGIPEVVSVNEGWIAKPADPHSLANQIKSCIEDDVLREQKVKNGILKVQQKFSKEMMIQAFEEYLKSRL